MKDLKKKIVQAAIEYVSKYGCSLVDDEYVILQEAVEAYKKRKQK